MSARAGTMIKLSTRETRVLAVIAGLLLWLGVAIAACAQNNAQFISQSVPLNMTPGQVYAVSVTMKNTGNTTWSAANGYYLHSQNPLGNTTWGPAHVVMPNNVTPGQSVTFSFNATAPSTPGVYNFQWRMLQQNVAWFGTPSTNVAVAVGGTNNAQFTSQSVPASMVVNQNYAVSVTLQNNGSTYWTVGDYYLGSQNPQDNTRWGFNRVELPNTVAPGQSVTFNFSVTPVAGGTRNFQWQMTQGGTRFGAATTNVAVAVSGTNDAQFNSQSVPANMVPGQNAAVVVTMKNTGNTTWSAGDLFRLGADNPPGNSTWGLAQVELPHAVAPGAMVSFSFNVAAPTAPGSYNFQWRMAQDGVASFGESSANVIISVQTAQATTMYFIHTDHLNTPRAITNSTGQLVWAWANDDPFGSNVPNEDPSALGAFTCNLRLPGQYFDKETGLFYNYHRNYAPDLGRYIESDPIGIRGGLNIYVYVLDPLTQIDPFGLMGAGAGANYPGRRPGTGNIWSGTSAQNWICDQPAGFLNKNPCVQRCCIKHDKCFEDNKCNWSSWFGNVFIGGSFPCNQCNSEAAKCVRENWGKTSCGTCD